MWERKGGSYFEERGVMYCLPTMQSFYGNLFTQQNLAALYYYVKSQLYILEAIFPVA